jgi:hypothetical protein
LTFSRVAAILEILCGVYALESYSSFRALLFINLPIIPPAFIYLIGQRYGPIFIAVARHFRYRPDADICAQRIVTGSVASYAPDRRSAAPPHEEVGGLPLTSDRLGSVRACLTSYPPHHPARASSAIGD